MQGRKEEPELAHLLLTLRKSEADIAAYKVPHTARSLWTESGRETESLPCGVSNPLSLVKDHTGKERAQQPPTGEGL